jgi:hypothetical protein
LHCGIRIEPTGEQIQRYINVNAGKKCAIVDAQLRLRLAIFLEYASSRSLFKKYVDLNDILNVFRARGKAKESEGTLRRHANLIMQRADVDGDGKLCVNEFLYALIQRGQAFEGLLLRAYTFAFTQLDYDGDGQATFNDLLWTRLKAVALLLAKKNKKKIGKALVGTFSIEKGAMVLEASMDQSTRLLAGGGDILQINKDLASIIRVEKGKQIYLDQPWQHKTNDAVSVRLIDKVEILKILGMGKKDLQAVELITAEEPVPVENEILKKEYVNVHKMYSKMTFTDPYAQGPERQTSILVHQFVVKAPTIPDIICLRSPYCDEIIDVASCLKPICNGFCQSNAPAVGNLCSAKTPLDWKTYSTSLRSLPCIRKYWGKARAVLRMNNTDYRSALTTLIKMKPYISKTLLENPNPENIAFNNAFEAELKCTNGKISNHREYMDPACHPISNMDIRLQEAQIQLAKDELAKGNDLSDNDFKCNVQVDFASIWSRKLKKEEENAKRGVTLRFKAQGAGGETPQSANQNDNMPVVDPPNVGACERGTNVEPTDEGTPDGCVGKDTEKDCDCRDKEDMESCPTDDPGCNDVVCACNDQDARDIPCSGANDANKADVASCNEEVEKAAEETYTPPENNKEGGGGGPPGTPPDDDGDGGGEGGGGGPPGTPPDDDGDGGGEGGGSGSSPPPNPEDYENKSPEQKAEAMYNEKKYLRENGVEKGKKGDYTMDNPPTSGERGDYYTDENNYKRYYTESYDEDGNKKVLWQGEHEAAVGNVKGHEYKKIHARHEGSTHGGTTQQAGETADRAQDLTDRQDAAADARIAEQQEKRDAAARAKQEKQTSQPGLIYNPRTGNLETPQVATKFDPDGTTSYELPNGQTQTNTRRGTRIDQDLDTGNQGGTVTTDSLFSSHKTGTINNNDIILNPTNIDLNVDQTQTHDFGYTRTVRNNEGSVQEFETGLFRTDVVEGEDGRAGFFSIGTLRHDGDSGTNHGTPGVPMKSGKITATSAQLSSQAPGNNFITIAGPSGSYDPNKKGLDAYDVAGTTVGFQNGDSANNNKYEFQLGTGGIKRTIVKGMKDGIGSVFQPTVGSVNVPGKGIVHTSEFEFGPVKWSNRRTEPLRFKQLIPQSAAVRHGFSLGGKSFLLPLLNIDNETTLGLDVNVSDIVHNGKMLSVEMDARLAHFHSNKSWRVFQMGTTQGHLYILQCALLLRKQSTYDFENPQCILSILGYHDNVNKCVNLTRGLRHNWMELFKKPVYREDIVKLIERYNRTLTTKCYRTLLKQSRCTVSKSMYLRKLKSCQRKFAINLAKQNLSNTLTKRKNNESHKELYGENLDSLHQNDVPPSISKTNVSYFVKTNVKQQHGRRRRNLLSRTTSKMTTTTNTKMLPPAMGVVIGIVGMLIGGILGGLGSGAPGFGKSDTVIPYLKKHVYEDVVADMTEEVATQVYEQVRPQLANHLIHSLSESVMESIRISLTHAIEHSIGNTVSIATTHGVKTMLTTMLPNQLYTSSTMVLVKTITRALTHALSPTLVETLSQTPEQRYYCYMCHSQGISSYCVYCDARTTTQTSKAIHYANFYASYYSDYYSDYYTKKFFEKNS